MLRRVRTDVSEELSVSFIRMTRIGEPGTTLAVTSNRRTLRRNTPRRNISEDANLHSHRRENLKSSTILDVPLQAPAALPHEKSLSLPVG
jgi:hypothetical protein